MDRILRASAAAASALLVAFFTVVGSAQTTPAAAVNDFYAAYAKQPFTGLPTGRAWTRISPRLSSSLGRLVVAAQKEQARCRKAHPDEKPPWIEGDMFTSNFEGFTKFTLAESGAASGARATVTVDFVYEKDTLPVAWRDDVSVVREGGHWLIDDVRYGRREGFTSGFGESLRKALAPGGGC